MGVDSNMPSATVRISPRGHSILRQLSRSSDRPMPELLEEALEAYRRQRFLEAASSAYDLLEKNDKAWRDYRREIESLDATLDDGLKD